MAAFLGSLLLVYAGRAAARSPFTDGLPQIFCDVGELASGFFSKSGATTVLVRFVCLVGWARLNVLVPVLRVTISASIVILAMMLAEKVFLSIVSLYVRLFRRKPEKLYEWKPIVEKESSAFPMVLVQIPMYNEKEVYKLSIGAAGRLSWPRDRFIVQVLDDSTDLTIKELVMAECRAWAAEGINVKYEVRKDRVGYKAGALKEGMKHEYVERCEYVAMFDADFQPDADFLMRTIPFLVHNPRFALVQCRWTFVNAGDCLLTRMQEMNLNYHFKVDQLAGSYCVAFFGYNGTAGVWRISAINDAGGWYERTTVEDMDLAVRAGLKGWKFVYVDDIKVKSELPSTFRSYRFQQHRWSCGPSNLFRKTALEIMTNQVSPGSVAGRVQGMKLYLFFYFFLYAKVLVPLQAFCYFCTAIPLTAFTPEINIPRWALVYAPLVMTVLKAIETPRSASLHLTVFWVLFENAMTLHRIKAVAIGLLGGRRANEWVVTKKLGDVPNTKPTAQRLQEFETSRKDLHVALLPVTVKPSQTIRDRFWERLNVLELVWGVFFLCCGFYDISISKAGFTLYALIQGSAFLLMGFGYIGISEPAPAIATDSQLNARL